MAVGVGDKRVEGILIAHGMSGRQDGQTSRVGVQHGCIPGQYPGFLAKTEPQVVG
jgi:hypothetical protein